MKLQADKVKHFAVCMAVALIVSVIVAVLTKNVTGAMFAGASSGMAIGVGKEYGDGQCSDNFWDWEDIAADALGALVGCCGGLLALIF